MQLNGLKLSCALEEFSITWYFLGSKMQKNKIWKKEQFIYAFEVQVISNRLADLKNTKPLSFIIFLKKCSFSTFFDYLSKLINFTY